MKFLSSDAARTVVLELVDNVLSSHSGPACDFHPSAVALSLWLWKMLLGIKDTLH